MTDYGLRLIKESKQKICNREKVVKLIILKRFLAFFRNYYQVSPDNHCDWSMIIEKDIYVDGQKTGHELNLMRRSL